MNHNLTSVSIHDEPLYLPENEVISLITDEVEKFDDIDQADITSFLKRAGNARVVLLGESTHGSSEFYRMRAKITSELITSYGFNLVCIEADWPDAALVHRYVCHLPHGLPDNKSFTRFPTWMWRNREFHDFVKWLRGYNESKKPDERIGFYGLDLYSLYQSIDSVIHHLQKISLSLADEAAQYYSCLNRWKDDPELYSFGVISGEFKSCESEVTHVLNRLYQERIETICKDDDTYIDLIQNARLASDAEKYYRSLYSSFESSWNLRDRHMFETLEFLLSRKGEKAKAIIWEHNSHIGNAAATSMSKQGEFNVGQLCREAMNSDAYLVGFGTDHGTVAASTKWGDEMQIMNVRPARSDSYEGIFHQTSIPSFFLPLRNKQSLARKSLLVPRLERAIGVIYKAHSERSSHYFEATLPKQFDEYIWFDKTEAITPLSKTKELREVPDTYPFGL